MFRRKCWLPPLILQMQKAYSDIMIEINYGKFYLFQVIKERREEYKTIHRSQKENVPCKYAFLAFKY
jgi:hypothetical protein